MVYFRLHRCGAGRAGHFCVMKAMLSDDPKPVCNFLNCSFAEMATREVERDTLLHQAVQRQQEQVSLVLYTRD